MTHREPSDDELMAHLDDLFEARQPGRQGPLTDPNRDGCGPAALLLIGALVALLVALVGAL